MGYLNIDPNSPGAVSAAGGPAILDYTELRSVDDAVFHARQAVNFTDETPEQQVEKLRNATTQLADATESMRVFLVQLVSGIHRENIHLANYIPRQGE